MQQLLELLDHNPTSIHTSQLVQLVLKTEEGDVQARAELCATMDANPALVEALGNLARAAELAWIDAASSGSISLKEAITRKLAALRAQLAGDHPTLLECLLVDRVVACWLELQHADTTAARSKKPSIEWSDHHQRRQERAHRKYLAALASLTTARRLLAPAVQVNIADHQVNVLQPGPPVQQP